MPDDMIDGGYEELHDIEKKRDEILWGLTLDKLIILAIFMIFLPFLFFKLVSMLNVIFGIVIAMIPLLFGAWLIWADGLDISMKYLNYYFSIQKGDLFSSELDYFINVKSIDDKIVYFRDGSMGVLFKVKPINFDIKNDREKKSIIYSYQKVLNSLNFEIKIHVRTVILNIDSYLNHVKNHFREDKNNPALKSLNFQFLNFWGNYTKDKIIKNRLFYVFVGLNKEEAIIYGNNKEHKLELKKRELLGKVERIKDRLNNIGIDCYELDKAELTNFFSNYFNSLEEKKEEFGFSLLLPQQVKFTNES